MFGKNRYSTHTTSRRKTVTVSAAAQMNHEVKTFLARCEPEFKKRFGRQWTEMEKLNFGILARLFAHFKIPNFYFEVSTILNSGFDSPTFSLIANAIKKSRTDVEPLRYLNYGRPIDQAEDPDGSLNEFPSLNNDPLAFWQHIAVLYEDNGFPVPAYLAPFTNTAAVRTVLARRAARAAERQRRKAEECILIELQQFVPAGSKDIREQVMGKAYVADEQLSAIRDLRVQFHANGTFELQTIRATKSGKVSKDAAWEQVPERLMRRIREADYAELPRELPAPARALMLALRIAKPFSPIYPKSIGREAAGMLLAAPDVAEAFVNPDGEPLRIAEKPPLRRLLCPAAPNSTELVFQICDTNDEPIPANELRHVGDLSNKQLLYLHNGDLRIGPPKIFLRTPLSLNSLNSPTIIKAVRLTNTELAPAIARFFKKIKLRPKLVCWIEHVTELSPAGDPYYLDRFFHARLCAFPLPEGEQQNTKEDGFIFFDGEWKKMPSKTAAGSDKNAPQFIPDYDFTDADKAAEILKDLKCSPDTTMHPDNHSYFHYLETLDDRFLDKFINRCYELGDALDLECKGKLAEIFADPIKASLNIKFSEAADAAASIEGRDWFDIALALSVSDITLTPDEIALLLKAKGKWVHLKNRGWRRLEFDKNSTAGDTAETLENLGITADDLLENGGSITHRVHALQLAENTKNIAQRDEAFAVALRTQAERIKARPVPPIPDGLRATLRSYQTEGFQFLTQLSQNSLGGILADDMGLGKTVQTLAWFLWLAEKEKAPAHFLVVCPKSVVHGWLTEAGRFAPSLAVTIFTPAMAEQKNMEQKSGDKEQGTGAPQLLIANYSQLRQQAAFFKSHRWTAAVLDEAQFIKNPKSKAAITACELDSPHRLALTGTPVENRLLDLWSLITFAQPGLLGTQAAFLRQYPQTDVVALKRLRRRVKHFMLRRTKEQATPDLPERVDDDIIIELDTKQRTLYDAELKRARAMLLNVNTNAQFSNERFNLLSSLLRLRQICCHPALVDPAHTSLPSEKLDALLERLAELREEGRQVLVFSQFVQMLEIISDRLEEAQIPHLLLTGATNNREELINKFQNDSDQTVFLLSLKAAGFGLNLTAASYVFMFDPWWNPAVEQQAIDRAYRIGQTQTVFAYRLVAANTVEEKIRALQRDKAALANSIVQEESLAAVLDLETLRAVLS